MTGLGVTTVSRALNDAPDIGQATKDRVRLVARQIGYRPNRAGVRLRTGKTNVISLILSIETEVLGLTSSHRLRHLRASRRDALPPDRHALLPAQRPAGAGALHRRDRLGGRHHLLAHRAAGPAGALPGRRAAFPSPRHGRTEMGIVHPYFDFDNAAYAEIAVDRLAARGRRRLALLPPPANLTYARHMAAGFVRGIERHDLVEVPVHGVDIDSSPDGDPGRDRPDDGGAAPARRHRLRQRRVGDHRDRRGRKRRAGDRAGLRRGGQGELRPDAQVPPRDRGGARGLPRRRHGPRARGAAHHRRRAGGRTADAARTGAPDPVRLSHACDSGQNAEIASEKLAP